ncbi:MAG: hypothetical protein ACR2NH_11205 [Solirubrobacteraceae bacterium]
MGQRSRKRRRAAEGGAAKPAGAPAGARPNRSERMEARNQKIRDTLEPLAEGERPRAVTVGAIVATVLALSNLVAYLAGLEVDGERPALTGILFSGALLGLAAYGMWRARYWAVLGFQFLLGLLLVYLALLLTRAESLKGVAIVLVIGIPAGTLFWALVRAMARLQMPERPRAS